MAHYKPGDILLVRAEKVSKISDLILAGERSRYGDSDYTRWTHSALVISVTGTLVEAREEGVVRSHVSRYRDCEKLVISPPVGLEQRRLAVRFAVDQLGAKYDILDFVGLACQALFGWQVSLHSDKRFICSGLVARATEKYIGSYPLASEAMLPADLAKFWDASTDNVLPALSVFGRFLDKVRAFTRAVSPF